MNTGFGFGAKTTATPTFGTGSITFGTPATQPAQQYGFGSVVSSAPTLFSTQTGTPAASLNFGAPVSQPSTGFAFASAAPSFGTPASTAPSTGFSLGATPAFGAAAPTTAASTRFSLGGAATPAFGAAVSSAAPSSGFSLGGFGATSTTAAPSTGLTLGATTTPAFGAPASTAASSTGFSLSSTPAASLTGFSLGTSTAASTTGFSFSGPAVGSSLFSSAPATTGFSFSTPNTGTGLGGLASTAPTFNLTTATTTSQSVGLGGVATTQTKLGTTASAQKELPPKEQLLPNEFSQLVEHFKTVVQEEKNRSSEVARSNIREFRKVESELDALNHQLSQMENQLLNNRNMAEQLKYDTAKGLQGLEMAQRTQDTPPTLQFENAAPLQFFLDLADNFERDLQMLKSKIDNTAKYVKKCNDPNVLTSQDLAQGLKRLHETFVALAGQMQAVHSQVETQKEAFLCLRKQATRDTTNPFENAARNIENMSKAVKIALKATPPSLASGPTPFNSIAMGSNNITLAAQQTAPPPYPATTSALGFGSSALNFGSPASNTSLFKPAGFATSPFQTSSATNFQLQKPPTGSKRGKQ